MRVIWRGKVEFHGNKLRPVVLRPSCRAPHSDSRTRHGADLAHVGTRPAAGEPGASSSESRRAPWCGVRSLPSGDRPSHGLPPRVYRVALDRRRLPDLDGGSHAPGHLPGTAHGRRGRFPSGRWSRLGQRWLAAGDAHQPPEPEDGRLLRRRPAPVHPPGTGHFTMGLLLTTVHILIGLLWSAVLIGFARVLQGRPASPRPAACSTGSPVPSSVFSASGWHSATDDAKVRDQRPAQHRTQIKMDAMWSAAW